MRKINQVFLRFLGVSGLGLCALTACSDLNESHLSQVSSKVASAQSYTDSIRQLANDAKSVVDSGLSEFNQDTLPHQAKDLRKQIVRLRDILDVFSHNFSHELKRWDEVRDALDDGYTVVGDYKDLFDTNESAVRAVEKGEQPEYKDQKKLNARRQKVLDWKETYFSQGGIAEKIWVLFGDIHALDARTVVNSKKYSDFFWGGVNAQPLPSATPAQNARRLVDAQSALVKAEHAFVLDIKDPSTEKNELLFHDHRKRLRTVVKVCNVANALSAETCQPAAVKELEALVVDLGEIEDLIITGRHQAEDGEKKKAKESYEDAQKKFKKLKNKFEDRNMLEPLERL